MKEETPGDQSGEGHLLPTQGKATDHKKKQTRKVRILSRVSVLATGGTIASSQNAQGSSTTSRSASDLLREMIEVDVNVTSRDIFRLGSFRLRHEDLRVIGEEVHYELAKPDVDGIVITHGTDTMEETAFMLDLLHNSPKPVVLTGAQRPADAPNADGPTNLRDAILVAASDSSRGAGVLIVFAGQIYAARGTRKARTLAASPFRTGGGGPIGHVLEGIARFSSYPRRTAAMPPLTERFDTSRVDVVSVHPGADAVLAEASIAAGARGIIIAGTGAGNGNPAFLSWVKKAVNDGIVVGLCTRVSDGPVVPIYGDGGGADLIHAGALGFGALPLFQARLLLAILLSQGETLAVNQLEPYL